MLAIAFGLVVALGLGLAGICDVMGDASSHLTCIVLLQHMRRRRVVPRRVKRFPELIVAHSLL